jgi:hypothetical protein
VVLTNWNILKCYNHGIPQDSFDISSSDDDHASIESQDSEDSIGKEKFISTILFSDENVVCIFDNGMFSRVQNGEEWV